MRRSRFAVLLACIMVCSPGFCLSAGAQPEEPAAEDVRNSGVVPDLNLKSEPKTIWAFSANNVSISSLVTAEDAVFFSTGDGLVHALRSSDGLKLWENNRFNGKQISGAAVSVNDAAKHLVVTTETGIVALNLKNGAVSWLAQVPEGLAAPLVVDRQVFAGGYDGILYSFNAVTGVLLWKHDFLRDAPADPPGFDGAKARFGDKPARPRALSSDGKLVFLTVFDQCRVLAIDRETGSRMWDVKTQGWMFGRPAVGRDRVFVGSQDKNLYAVDIGSGNVSWIVKTKSRVEAPAAANDRYVFCGSCDANLYCLDKVTGQQIWKQATDRYEKYGGPIYEQPIVSKDAVYLAAMEGQIYRFRIDNGEIQWKFRPSEDSQIDGSCTDGKRIYVTTRPNFDDKGNNALYAIGQE